MADIDSNMYSLTTMKNVPLRAFSTLQVDGFVCVCVCVCVCVFAKDAEINSVVTRFTV
jgi:hypothetical protein